MQILSYCLFSFASICENVRNIYCSRIYANVHWRMEQETLELFYVSHRNSCLSSVSNDIKIHHRHFYMNSPNQKQLRISANIYSYAMWDIELDIGSPSNLFSESSLFVCTVQQQRRTRTTHDVPCFDISLF